MRYAAKLLIPSRRLAVINGYLNAEQEDEFQGEDNTIIHTVSFPRWQIHGHQVLRLSG